MLATSKNLKIVVKGIQSAEDAKLAVAHGADAVWICSSPFESDPTPISILKHVKAQLGSKT